MSPNRFDAVGNPITHLVTAVRELMSGDMTAGSIGLLLLACAALIAVFAPLTIHLYGTRT